MKIKIRKKRLKDIINEILVETINERKLLMEMAKINKKDVGNVPFPYNKFTIVIYPDDHTPPHFHVICEDWNMRFLIENGELYREDTSMGSSSKIYSYILKNIKQWMKMPNSSDKTKTNQEYMMELWEYYHVYDNIK